MRRKDREITDEKKIDEIIGACHCCRLGFNDGGRVYIVPLSFGFEAKDGRRIFYFHSANEGRKIELIKKSDYAAFELDTNYRQIEAETACRHSARYQSVIGEGRVEFVTDSAEKERALLSIMRRTTGKDEWSFEPSIFEVTAVFKLIVEELSCKERL